MQKEQTASLIFFCLGAYGFVFGLGLPVGSLREPGPGMLPLSLSALLCISGILRFAHTSHQGKEMQDRERRGRQDGVKKLSTPLKIIGVTITHVVVLKEIGYLLGSLFYLFVLFFWVSRYKVWVAAGLAVLIGAGSWFFFGKILAIQLPKGCLPL